MSLFTVNMYSMYPAINQAVAALKIYEKDVVGPYLAVIDFKSPSNLHRLVILDRAQGFKIVKECHVAHGSKSESLKVPGMADSFSNVIGSRKSSLGAMITGEEYIGKHGSSLRLHGLEKGVNSNVYLRSMVIHAAGYVKPDFIFKNKRAGCSWGCFAVCPADILQVIQLLPKGSFLYASY